MSPRGPEDAQRRIAPQLAILVLAIVLAALGGAASFAGLVASYLAAWAIVSIAVARGIAMPRATRGAEIAGTLLVVAAPIAILGGRIDALAETEMLVGLDVNVRDRVTLEREVAIHPAVVSIDRPQTLFVRTGEDAREVTLSIGGSEPVEAEGLGHGVFRVDLDPRETAIEERGATTARLEIDGDAVEREVEVIAPLAHPRVLRVSPDRARACTTSEETDELIVIEGGAAERIPVDDGPSDCAFAGERIVVTHRHDEALAWVERDRRERSRTSVGAGQHRVAVSPDGARVAVAHEDGRITILADAGAPITIAIGGVPDWIELAESGDALIVARRAPAALLRIVIEAGSARIARTRVLLAPAVTMARGAGGASVVIAATDWADAPSPHLGNHFVEDQLLTFDATTLELIDRRTTAGRTPRQDAAGGLDRGLSPSGIDVAPDGALWVAFAGSDEVARLAEVTRWIDTAPLGLSAPSSVAVLADGSIAVTSPSSGRIAILDRDRSPVASIALAAGDDALLRDDPDALRRRFGERAFYEATRAGVSCQSCHLHGASDGLLHNIGGRALVPTIDVRGIRGTSPYLRDGSYPRISDLHLVADELYRGWREPAGDRGATIEAWLASSPVPASHRAREPETERRGLDVFVRAGCPDCHAPPAFTSLARHPLRSVFPDAIAPDVDADPGTSLDVPTLRAVSSRSRWLFDGRARSLASIFTTHARGGRHGRTSGLSEDELADLVRFLESL